MLIHKDLWSKLTDYLPTETVVVLSRTCRQIHAIAIVILNERGKAIYDGWLQLGHVLLPMQNYFRLLNPKDPLNFVSDSIDGENVLMFDQLIRVGGPKKLTLVLNSKAIFLEKIRLLENTRTIELVMNQDHIERVCQESKNWTSIWEIIFKILDHNLHPIMEASLVKEGVPLSKIKISCNVLSFFARLSSIPNMLVKLVNEYPLFLISFQDRQLEMEINQDFLQHLIPFLPNRDIATLAQTCRLVHYFTKKTLDERHGKMIHDGWLQLSSVIPQGIIDSKYLKSITKKFLGPYSMLVDPNHTVNLEWTSALLNKLIESINVPLTKAMIECLKMVMRQRRIKQFYFKGTHATHGELFLFDHLVRSGGQRSLVLMMINLRFIDDGDPRSYTALLGRIKDLTNTRSIRVVFSGKEEDFQILSEEIKNWKAPKIEIENYSTTS